MESILYVGTDHGVATARSQDGRSWEVASRGLEEWGVPEVAVIPGAPNQVLAGTRGDGVWFSEDFGKSWRKPNRGRHGPGKVRCLTIAPDNPRRVYAGCEPIDVFVSEDLGANWARLHSVWDDPFISTIPYPGIVVEPHVRDITIDPTHPDTIYAALQVGFMLKSTDGGETWRLLNKGFDCDVHTIVLDPSQPQRVLIATGGGDSRSGRAPGKALYLSEDGGEGWVPLAMNFEQTYSVPLAVDPQAPDTIYSAVATGPRGSRLRDPSAYKSVTIRSQDGGKSWMPLDLGPQTSEDFPVAIAVDDERPGRVYMGLQGGSFYCTEDSGDTWDQLDLKLDGVANVKLVHA